jgi:hypothetical protein
MRTVPLNAGKVPSFQRVSSPNGAVMPESDAPILVDPQCAWIIGAASSPRLGCRAARRRPDAEARADQDRAQGDARGIMKGHRGRIVGESAGLFGIRDQGVGQSDAGGGRLRQRETRREGFAGSDTAPAAMAVAIARAIC